MDMSQSEQAPNKEQVTQALDFLDVQGYVYSYRGLPNSADFERWKIELSRHSYVSTISLSRKREFKVKVEGPESYSGNLVILGYQGLSRSKTPQEPGILFGRMTTDRWNPRPSEFWDLTMRPQNLELLLPMANIPVNLLVDTPLEPIFVASLAQIDSRQAYDFWKSILSEAKGYLSPVTIKSFSMQLESSPFAPQKKGILDRFGRKS